MKLKECTRCGILKEEDNYYKLSQNRGIQAYCKSCRRSEVKARIDKLSDSERDLLKERNRAYYRTNNVNIQLNRKLMRNTDIICKLKHMYRNAKQRAKIKDFSFDLEYEDIMSCWKNQKGICALSGEIMTVSGDMLSNKVSLDRIDSSKGYIKTNIQLVTVKVNYMKRDMNQKDFKELCKKVALCD